MKKSSLPLIIGLIALSGCASHYVIRLDNNSEITTATKPKLKDQVYYFKDTKGEEQSVPKFRVRELAPAAMAAREDKPRPAQVDLHKKRKSHFLWLASLPEFTVFRRVKVFLPCGRAGQAHRCIAWSPLVFVMVRETALMVFTLVMRCARALGGRMGRARKRNAMIPSPARALGMEGWSFRP